MLRILLLFFFSESFYDKKTLEINKTLRAFTCFIRAFISPSRAFD